MAKRIAHIKPKSEYFKPATRMKGFNREVAMAGKTHIIMKNPNPSPFIIIDKKTRRIFGTARTK